MRTEDLSEIERFFKGEAHFLHLQPNDSRDRFWEFRDRDDDIVVFLNGQRVWVNNVPRGLGLGRAREIIPNSYPP